MRCGVWTPQVSLSVKKISASHARTSATCTNTKNVVLKQNLELCDGLQYFFFLRQDSLHSFFQACLDNFTKARLG